MPIGADRLDHLPADFVTRFLERGARKQERSERLGGQGGNRGCGWALLGRFCSLQQLLPALSSLQTAGVVEAHDLWYEWDMIRPMPAGAHGFALPIHPGMGVPREQPANTPLFYLLPQDDQDDQGDDGEDQQGQDDGDDDHFERQGYNDNHRDSSQTPPPLHTGESKNLGRGLTTGECKEPRVVVFFAPRESWQLQTWPQTILSHIWDSEGMFGSVAPSSDPRANNKTLGTSSGVLASLEG